MVIGETVGDGLREVDRKWATEAEKAGKSELTEASCQASEGVMTDFGQCNFGNPFLAIVFCRPILANPFWVKIGV